MLEAAVAVILWLFFKQYPVVWLVCGALFVPGLYAMITGAPFVPTSGRTMRTMLGLAAIQPGEHVYDLGCGDGRLLLRAAGKGAKAVGYELSVPTYALARLRCVFRRNIRVRFADFWSQSYGDADVIFCYLLTDSMRHFETRIWPGLPAGCRVVSHAFSMKNVPYAQKKDGVLLYVK
ncbi:MAG: hypothetical protein JWM56_54 [Candidatus Peribacteria bacterium]|nr:hypothetical protein [Candidatus Peribacteria bacterium]